jgi:hypothetical protein
MKVHLGRNTPISSPFNPCISQKLILYNWKQNKCLNYTTLLIPGDRVTSATTSWSTSEAQKESKQYEVFNYIEVIVL